MNQKTSSCNKCGKYFTRSTGVKKHRHTCTGAPAANKRCTGHGVAPERLQFKLHKK